MSPPSSIVEVVEHGADVKAVDASGNTSLHFVFLGDRGRNPTRNYMDEAIEIVDYLLQEGADINAQNNADETPLDEASRYGRDRVIAYLLEKGADARLARGSLHHAARRRLFTMTFMLLEAGVFVDIVDDRGRTPLHLTITGSNVGYGEADIYRLNGMKLPIIFLLIQNGADIHAETQDGWTPFLHMATLVGGSRSRYNEFMEFVGWCDRMETGGTFRHTYCYGDTLYQNDNADDGVVQQSEDVVETGSVAGVHLPDTWLLMQPRPKRIILGR